MGKGSHSEGKAQASFSHQQHSKQTEETAVYKTNHGERNRTWEPSWAKDVAQQVDHALTAHALNLGKRW